MSSDFIYFSHSVNIIANLSPYIYIYIYTMVG